MTLIAAFASVLLLQPPAPAQPPAAPPAAALTARSLDLKVDGVDRHAIIYAPASAKQTDTPVVFAFHGHGGNARNSANTFGFQRAWPEAITVYMQGLPTPGALTDPDGKLNGWQKFFGDQGDRDLKFFDAMLADLGKTYKIDHARIYATGHSNGGAFTYLLWAARPDVFAAFAPSAAAPGRNLSSMKPKPAMHIAGQTDTTVPFEFQQRAMESVRKLNGCEAEGHKWADQCLEYSSKSGAVFVSFIHPGTHKYPEQAPALIVKFFKEHSLAKAEPAKPPAKPER